MRGKRARRLRKAATRLCESREIPLGKGYGEYNQAMNCLTMDVARDKDDNPIKVGHEFMLAPKKNPGTVTCAWALRNMYKTLKRLYRNGSKRQLFEPGK